jgi:5-methylcytosine-specific restriction endonuclease McrA
MKDKLITKECKTHGLTEYILENRGAYRCKKCRSDAVTRKRRNLKIDAVAHMGGECQDCGYSKCTAAMEFHHLDGIKEFAISGNGSTISWEKMKEELKKCVLLCSNCHRERHSLV